MRRLALEPLLGGEAVGVGNPLGVAVVERVDDHDLRTRRQGLAPQLDVGGRLAREHRRGRPQAHRLLEARAEVLAGLPCAARYVLLGGEDRQRPESVDRQRVTEREEPVRDLADRRRPRVGGGRAEASDEAAPVGARSTWTDDHRLELAHPLAALPGHRVRRRHQLAEQLRERARRRPPRRRGSAGGRSAGPLGGRRPSRSRRPPPRPARSSSARAPRGRPPPSPSAACGAPEGLFSTASLKRRRLLHSGSREMVTRVGLEGDHPVALRRRVGGERLRGARRGRARCRAGRAAARPRR